MCRIYRDIYKLVFEGVGGDGPLPQSYINNSITNISKQSILHLHNFYFHNVLNYFH